VSRVADSTTHLGTAFSSEQLGGASGEQVAHVTVCICTYKRPELLERLLRELKLQDTDGLFTFSVVVADNDSLQSARPVVSNFSATSSIPIKYCVVPEQNISLARNTAIANAYGEFFAFIDDDEFPTKRWLVTLYITCKAYGVDGALGPVKRYFDVTPPKWVIASKFYDRKTYPTGTAVEWKEGRTGNVLLKSSILAGVSPIFRPEFRGGEDTDFFSRMIDKGHKFIWCDEAIAYEVIPPSRWSRSFLLRRALLRGTVALKYQNFGPRDIAKSVVAVPLYILGLPFALIRGQHRFMDLLVRLFDHVGKLLAIVGINVIKEHYITE
jgi:glycosyltransferase involved in cell wall biosynthesis